MSFSKPARPVRLISRDGKWEILPTIHLLRCFTVTPKDETKADKLDPVTRILYSANLYDDALAMADKLIAGGHNPSRIEMVHAYKEEFSEIARGNFSVVARKP